MQKKVKMAFALLMCALNITVATAQFDYYANMTKLPYLNKKRSERVAQDNEFEKNESGQYANFGCSPLQLDGHGLDLEKFDLMTKGVITIVKDKDPIAFYVSIRRDGKILEDKKLPSCHKAVNKVNLSDILPHCKDGDLLILNPVDPNDWKAKRILKLLGGC